MEWKRGYSYAMKIARIPSLLLKQDYNYFFSKMFDLEKSAEYGIIKIVASIDIIISYMSR